jgi:beta-mannosidase
VRLDGSWRVASLTPDLERRGGDPDLDDHQWPEVAVPGHWTAVAEVAHEIGPVLYRRRFSHPGPTEGERWWLVLDGVIDQGDVWLDGGYLGDTEGYFVSHRFEITETLARGQDHLLAVGVSCPPLAPGRSKRALTGSLQAGDLAPPGHPGGIWRPVTLSATGPIAIRHERLLCLRADARLAEVGLRLVLDAVEAVTATVETTVTGPGGEVVVAEHEERPLAAGENRLAWSVEVPEPERWWPAALGDQPLYTVEVRVLVDGGPSDHRRWRTGLRSVRLDDFVCRVNGERLFLKGVALGPQSAHLASLDPAVIAQDLRAARDAGFDLVRVHGHVARPELYEAADELGLLLWQDLPLVGRYATSTRSQARRQAREAVDQLGHHPSVAVWCAHEEPNGPPVAEPASDATRRRAAGRAVRHLLPSWNRSLLDPQLRRVLRSADPSRPVIAHAGMLPHPIRLAGTDSHLWMGWRTGRDRDLPRLLRRWPRLGRFVGAFGTQSVSLDHHPEGGEPLLGAQEGSFERYLPRTAHPDGMSWAEATRAYQAAVLRSHIETLRRLKYRPTGGFCASALIDADPVVGFGLLDSERRTKPAYDAVVDACRPVVVVADPPPELLTPGEQLDLAVHVVTDRRHPIPDVRVTARVTVGEHRTTQVWTGDLDADTVAFVGRLRAEVPVANGELSIDLELEAEGEIATNRYRAVVIPPSESTGRVAGAGSR